MENNHQKIRKLVREIIKESFQKTGLTTLYHGSHENSNKFLKQKLIYLSTEKSFAKDYGINLFSVKVNLGKIFDSTNLKDIEKLYQSGFKLTDPYLDSDLDNLVYNFKKEEYPTAKSFINSPYSISDSWNAIESTEGVIGWIFKNGYDSILITEGGTENYLIQNINVDSFENISLLKEEVKEKSITDNIEIITGEEFLKRYVDLPEKMLTKVLFNYEGEIGNLSMGESLGKGEYFCATKDCVFHYENDDYFGGYSHAELNKNAKIGILKNPYSVDKNFFSEISNYVDALYSPNENEYGYLGLVVYNPKILS